MPNKQVREQEGNVLVWERAMADVYNSEKPLSSGPRTRARRDQS